MESDYDRHCAVHEEDRLARTSDNSLEDAALPDPADVPRSEPWLVEYRGEHRIGLRIDPDDIQAWRLPSRDIDNESALWARDTDITLVSRLVPECPARTIDKPEGLDALPEWSVVLDQDGEAWQKGPSGYWVCGTLVKAAGELIDRRGPVTVIHEPEVTA